MSFGVNGPKANLSQSNTGLSSMVGNKSSVSLGKSASTAALAGSGVANKLNSLKMPEGIQIKINPGKDFQANPGQIMRGEVLSTEGNKFTMQVGRHTLEGQTSLKFAQGQQVDIAFSKVTDDKQLGFKVLQSVKQSVSSDDMSLALNQMKVPVNERNLAIAKSLIQFEIPLNAKKMGEFIKVLSSLGRPMNSMDLTTACLLSKAHIPLTPKNILLLSTLLSNKPMMGSHLEALTNNLNRMIAEGGGKNMEAMTQMKNLLEGLTLKPGVQNRQEMSQVLQNLALQQGAEISGGNKEALSKMLSDLQGMQNTAGNASESASPALVAAMGQNLMACNLLNSGKIGSELAFLYLQIPVAKSDNMDTTELMIDYYEDEDRKVVDPENTKIKFDVNTENMGRVRVDLNVRQGLVKMEIDTQDEDLQSFVDKFVPLLRKNIYKIGYSAEQINVGILTNPNTPFIIHKQETEEMKKVDVQI